ncbi:cation:proton antiporter domain-containing protein [Pontivivens insulae]|uniref:Glutathione-regulated potassium-efflux system protein KefC n=1 Tax=Pontivivens insulae TaxID=1639689 RepID=A0A2R8AA17_9RHOB|nr:cation:proton antiporter [Pontivivens insulae]RED12984.1 Kef-type potassium/proton antiporter (CPA2 family) [Pontivivens insulae]SPF29077.1 Glutathione-regulated potassium-efflux system protein KefC [Pontivivens insulae]
MTDFLLLAFIFLVAGVIAVPIATRLGLGSVLGYLIAGIVISPALSLLGVDVISIQHFAEFGVVMMLFLVGLELEPKVLWQMRARLMGLGGGQIGLTTLAVMGVAMIFGQPWTVALAIGLVLAMSSTAIVLQTLNEKGLMKSDGGQSSFSVLLSQDIAVIPMLALLPLLAMPELADLAGHGADAGHGAGGHGEAAHGDAEHHDDGHGGGDHGSGMSLVAGLATWQVALVNVFAIAAVVLGGIYLTRPMFRFIAGAQLRELFTAAALLMVIGIALLMTLVGLSPALGTFLAGVVLANSEYRHELESDIDPFKGLLLGLFFMTVGAGINFALLFENLALIVGLTLGLIALKAGVLFALSIVFGPRGSDRWLMALGLAQAGEFGFVLLSFATANAVLPTEIADRLLLVVALSMLLTPALFILYDRVIAPRFDQGEEREADEMPEDSKIIIAGMGRIGGIVDRMLSAAGYSTTVIDYSSRQLDNMRVFGVQAYFGDATRPDLLHAAGIDNAKLLVIAIDGQEQITELVRYVKANHPHVHVMARAVNRHHVYELWAAGCRDIIRETYDSSVRMGRSAFEALGIDPHHAQQMADAFTEHDREVMISVADVYDPDIPATENTAYVERVREVRGPIQDRLNARMSAIRGLTEDS